MGDSEKKICGRDRIVSRMDEVLAEHFERLIGTRSGIGGLPLTGVTLAITVILAENRTAVDASQSAILLTPAALQEELVQMGFSAEEGFGNTFRRMAETGYFSRSSIGMLAAGEAAIKTARLLQRVYPGMPGLQFAAYVGQTIQEVASGRKDLQSALDQFSQTLAIQGRRLVNRAEPLRPDRVASDSARKEPACETPQSGWGGPRGTPPKVIGAGHGSGSYSVRKVEEWETLGGVSNGMSDPPAPVKAYEPEVVPPETEADQAEQGLPRSAPNPESEPRTLPGPNETDGDRAALPGKIEIEQEKPEVSPPPPQADGVSGELGLRRRGGERRDETEADFEEDLIEGRVQAFEGDLAMICPHCGKGRIEIRKTSTDKTYYVCSEKGCAFVSWGRPHHLACPRCKNPFLIELNHKGGEAFLRCPRATCGYQQRLLDRGFSPDPAPPSTEASKQPGAEALSVKPVRRRVVRRRR